MATKAQNPQKRNEVGECRDALSAVAVPLSPLPPATTAPARSKAGFTFRDIIAACERGNPLPPEVIQLEATLLTFVREITNTLSEVFGDSNYLQVGYAIQQLPKSDTIFDAPIEALPLRLKRVAPLWRTFMRRLPPRVRKLVSKYYTPKRKQKIVKPKVVTGLTRSNRTLRSPPAKRRKARDENAEGDADSHCDFWFGLTKPRAIRAPTPRCRGSRDKTREAAVWSFLAEPA